MTEEATPRQEQEEEAHPPETTGADADASAVQLLTTACAPAVAGDASPSQADAPVSEDTADESHAPTTGRSTLAASIRSDARGGYEVLVMTPGPGNGWTWPHEVLARDAQVFDGVTSFLDHERLSVQVDRPGGRSAEHICGVIADARWEQELDAIVARFSPRRPKGDLAVALAQDYLTDLAAGSPAANIGLSADVTFAHAGSTVTRLIQAHSVDVVFDPARGGRFVRALLANASMAHDPVLGEAEPLSLSCSAEGGAQPQEDTIMEPETVVTPAVTAPPTPIGAPPAEATALWRRQSQATLDTTLTGSGLPVAAQNRVRAQFADQVILDVDTLDAVIADERAYLAQINPPAPTNAGAHEERDRVIRVGGTTLRTGPTTDPLDRIRLGLVRWFGGKVPPGIDPSSVPHLDISEFYADMTGDATLQGVWNLDEARRRTGLALSLTDTTMAQVVADAMNVVILDQWDIVAAAGYK
jgi:hypothetical protein